MIEGVPALKIDAVTLRHTTRRILGRVPVFLQPLLFLVLPVILLHPLWTAGLSDAGARERPVKVEPTRTQQPPVAFDVIREEIEAHEEWNVTQKAICPRRIPDRIEQRDSYPAIAALRNIDFVTVTNDTSRGQYEQVIEITSAGRLDLMNDLDEQPEHYMITIARRAFIDESEQFEGITTNDDDERRFRVRFLWQWEPVNQAGERLVGLLGDNPRRGGVATYVETDEGWELETLWLEIDFVDLSQPQ